MSTTCFASQPELHLQNDEDTQYRDHVAANLEIHPWARVLKVSDFTNYVELCVNCQITEASVRKVSA
jgi:hypothetical protein